MDKASHLSAIQSAGLSLPPRPFVCLVMSKRWRRVAPLEAMEREPF